MAAREEVERFLSLFLSKLKVFDLIYRDDRGKNQQTLEELEIKPSYRREIIENLTVNDYVEGPLIDTLNNIGDMWVFGKDVKGRAVYIKISLGNTDCQTICISFHLAEHELKYPFKNKEEKQ